MARFRGTVQGSRGEGSRLGHRAGGLRTRASGWHGSVEVELLVNGGEDGEDWARVTLYPDIGNSVQLYHGPLAKYQDPRGVQIPIGVTDPSES